MQKYEIMAIVKNSLDVEAAKKVCTDVIVGKIKSFEGHLTFEDFWGERGFAYKIKQMTWGYYFVAQFEMDADKIITLRNELNIEKDIIRFLVTTVNRNMPEPLKYAEVRAANEAQAKKEQKEVSDKQEAIAAKRREKLTTVKTTPVQPVKDKPEKTSEKPKKENDLDNLIAQSAAEL